MISVIRQFHDGLRAYVRLDDRVCSGWFAVKQDLRQGCVLMAVINVTSTRFKADKGIMDALVHLRTEKGAGGQGGITAGEPVLAMPLRGMLYADDAGVVSQSSEQLRKMLGVIVVVCAPSGLAVSEAKTEMMCLRAKGMPESTTIFSVEAAGQVYSQTNEFVYLGGNVDHKSDLSIEADRRNAWCSFQKYTPELYERPSASLELKNMDAKSRGTRDNVVQLRHVKSARVPLRHAALSPLQLIDSLHRLAKAQSRRLPDFLSRHVIETESESIKATSCSRDLWPAWRIRDCRSG